MKINQHVKDGDVTTRSRDGFPAIRFLAEHFFETLAIVITVVGILGYAAGASFNEGWNSAAGIPPGVFQIGVQEAILKGLGLHTPWLYTAIGLSIVCFEIWLINCIEIWLDRKNSLKRAWRLLNRARQERSKLEPSKKKDARAFQEWRQFRSQENLSNIRGAINTRHARYIQYARPTVYFSLQLGCIVVAGAFYVLAKILVVKQSGSEGARQFVELYAAVTGKVPIQFQGENVSRAEILDYACKGKKALWKYRVSRLNMHREGDGTHKLEDAYILQGTDKVFLLLSESGVRIQSFADSGFQFEEATVRPVSSLIKSCV